MQANIGCHKFKKLVRELRLEEHWICNEGFLFCKRSMSKFKAMGLNFNLITEPPQACVLFSQWLMAMGW